MRKKYKILLLLSIIILLVSMSFVFAGSVNIKSGRVLSMSLETTFDSYNWAGLKVINDGTPLLESTFSFLNLQLKNPGILETSFPGYNLKGGSYYYASMFSPSFNLLNVKNISSADLESNQLFNSTNYPQFYVKDYDSYSDNPKNTFNGNLTTIPLGGNNYTAFEVTLNTNINYYLLKYDDGENETPLFLSEFKDAICYNSTACVSQFLLPKTDKAYNFFLLGMYESYDYDIWIDSIATSSFSQTGLPYNLTVRVKNLYSGLTVPNASVLVGEDSGQNLFIPYTLSGFVSHAYSVGKTNDQGFETFLVAPTVYPSIPDYSIYVAVLREESKVSKENLYVTSMDSLVNQQKTLNPSRLRDNAVASVNAMNQIVSFLYTWTSQRVEALKFKVDYDVLKNNFTTYDLQTSLISPNPITIKTGAPNVFTVTVSDTGGTPSTNFKARVKEEGGYLIMNPYTDTSPLTKTARTHTQLANINEEFIITPTTLGFVNSNVTIEILDSSDNVIGSFEVPINANLNIDRAGSLYNNDLLKTIVNAMNQVLNSLYNSIN